MRVLLWSGVAAPLVYVIAVAWGGASTPLYDHLRQAISELTATGTSGTAGVVALLGVYNLLLGAFALGLWLQMRQAGIAFWFVAAGVADIALFGLLLLVFPMDQVGTPMSLTGILHIVFAGLTSIWTMLTMGAMAWGWRSLGRGDNARVDTALLVAVAASGLLAATGTALSWPIAGLLERVTIGVFLLWVALTAGRLLGDAQP